MTPALRLHADSSAPPEVEVRASEPPYTLVKCITTENAGELARRGWAEWIGRGSRRHLRLTARAPLNPLPSHRSPGTQRDRADQTCRTFQNREPLGGPWVVEHRLLT